MHGRTVLHGGAEYRTTGRGFVVFHAKFADNYRLYSRNHFVKGLELMILLVVYEIFGHSYSDPVAYVFITISTWFMVGTWLFAPFLFNPSGFEWQKIVDDWNDWNKWISNYGGIDVPPEKSWESWWAKEQEHLRYTGKRGIILEIVLELRFFRLSIWACIAIKSNKACQKCAGLWWFMARDLRSIAHREDCLDGKTFIQCKFSAGFPIDKKGLIFFCNIYLSPNPINSSSSHDSARHNCCRPCFHAYWMGFAVDCTSL